MLPKKDDTNTFGHDYAEECENNNFELSKMSSANNSIYKQNSEQQHHHHQRIISFDNNIYDNGKSFDETVEDDAKLNGDDTKHINNTVVLYEQYQKEFEDLKRDSSQIEREHYIELLESMVCDLIDQNKCLAENIAELKDETEARIEVIHEQLGTSARRTEEVMLSLESHEVLLKQFVQRHCCTCCGCDMRTASFQMCHGNDCDAPGGHFEQDQVALATIPKQCWSYGFQWNSILNQIQAWFLQNGHFDNFVQPKDNYRSTSANFTSLVTKIGTRINKLETENEELRYDNQMVRQLNGLLSGRNQSSTQTTIKEFSVSYEKDYNTGKRSLFEEDEARPRRRYRVTSIDSDTLSLNQLFDNQTDSDSLETTAELRQDLMTFLSKSTNNFENDSCCSESRSDSMTSRHDGDSGCSADLTPGSHADMHSLLSEYEAVMGNTSLSSNLSSNCSHNSCPGLNKHDDEDALDYPTSDISEHFQSDSYHHHQRLKQRLEAAERLVPKLYNRLMYYITQRNLLLKQMQFEAGEREKCKKDVAQLVDLIQFEMKGLGEMGTTTSINKTSNDRSTDVCNKSKLQTS